MPWIPSATGTTLKPYRLTNEELVGVGRLIQACAEIEDIIDLYIFELAKIGLGPGMLMLGRMPISGKVTLIGQLAATRGPYHVGKFKLAFDNDGFRHIIRFRNIFAHGVLLGETEDGSIAFQVREVQNVDESEVLLSVHGVQHSDFTRIAESAETIIPALEGSLGVKALREKRRSQSLGPHRKSQPTRPPSAKHPRQHPPSGV